MMFLQYFMQGCYLPVASLYLQDSLGFEKQQVGYFSSALSIGPLLAPLFVGQLVDRHFATQRVLACCHLVAGGLMLALYAQRDFWSVITLGTLYSILWVPTMMLTNSLALFHLQQRDREFPTVRLWGTIGFILPAWLIEGVWLAGLEGDALNTARGVTFALSGVTGLVMAVYCWTLPNTPPSDRSKTSFAPAQAANYFLSRELWILVLASFGIALVHQFYFVWNSPFLSHVLKSGGVTGAYEQRISSLGQISEVLVLAGLGLAVTRFGFKRVMLVGATAYALRCALFALVAAAELPFAASITLAGLGNALHGFCFGAFLAAAFMYVDRHSPRDIRGSAQTMYGTLILGTGFLLGGIVAGKIGEWFTTVDSSGEKLANWTMIWGSCAAWAIVCVAVFALGFREQTASETA
ncbi:MAG: MFS transporter [Planctomycetaceae bacterium]|nr:MFS transporter [Planctomycetaceae bacterium]